MSEKFSFSSLKAAKKGISPLIATVLLIAFTMAIAGIMASWATTFAGQQLGSPSCPGALSIYSLSFDDTTGNLSIVLTNSAASLNLTGIAITVFYPTTVNNYNLETTSIGALETKMITFSTGSTTKPEKITVKSKTCSTVPPIEGRFS